MVFVIGKNAPSLPKLLSFRDCISKSAGKVRQIDAQARFKQWVKIWDAKGKLGAVIFLSDCLLVVQLLVWSVSQSATCHSGTHLSGRQADTQTARQTLRHTRASSLRIHVSLHVMGDMREKRCRHGENISNPQS